jgi:hypothetical protein
MSDETLAPATRAWRSHGAVRDDSSCAASGPFPATIADAASSAIPIPANADLMPRPARRRAGAAGRRAVAWLKFMNKPDGLTSRIRLTERPEAIRLR